MTDNVVHLQPRRPGRAPLSPLDRAAVALAATPVVSSNEARALARLCLGALAPCEPDHDEKLFARFHDDPAAARAIVEDWIKAVLS